MAYSKDENSLFVNDAAQGVKGNVEQRVKQEDVVLLPVIEFFHEVLNMTSQEHQEMSLVLEEADYSTLVKYSRPYVFEVDLPSDEGVEDQQEY